MTDHTNASAADDEQQQAASPSPEALHAVKESTDALRRAARIAEVDAPAVARRRQEIRISNGLVVLFKQALGVTT